MPETHARFLYGEGKGQRKFCSNIHSYLANGKPQHMTARSQNLRTSAVVHTGIQVQQAIPRSAVKRRIRKHSWPATAILDRLIHHATTINIFDHSYRLKGKIKAGLVQTEETSPTT